MDRQEKFLAQLRERFKNKYTLQETLRMHHFNEAAEIVDSYSYAKHFVPHYRTNMFGPVIPPPDSLTKPRKLERYFGKP
jgi:hypothetical protein